jgi:transcriptional regulator with XRE-family HTH domain
MMEEHEIGGNIKKMRTRLRLSLSGLAEQTGLTKSYLSRVENSDKAPPVSTLYKISKALGVTVSEILGEKSISGSISHVKKCDRKQHSKGGSSLGYSFESLVKDFSNRHMEPFVVTGAKNANKKPTIFQHPGEEIHFQLRGTVRFMYGDEEYLVEEGDCLYFDANIPHTTIQEGSEKAEYLVILFDS